MKEIYKNYLFEKHILVNDGEKETTVFETLFSLAHFFGIRITDGKELATASMIRTCSDNIGTDVPEPFYRGFPQTVKELSASELLYDQLCSYARTYGMNAWDETVHSVFESDFERAAFTENTETKDFIIITGKEAETKLKETVSELLAGSRPLNRNQYNIVLEYITDNPSFKTHIGSKNTVVRLLIDTENTRFADDLALSDVIKLVDELNFREYGKTDMTKLNLKNRHRKFISNMLDRMFSGGNCDIKNCYEKKKTWNGLLHHIHYKPKNESARIFVEAMRSKGNESVYSRFEKAMSDGKPGDAANILKDSKGVSAMLRHMDYIISRMDDAQFKQFCNGFPEECSVTVLIQLLFRYGNRRKTGTGRIFCFTRHNMLQVHEETESEFKKRKSRLTKEREDAVASLIKDRLKSALKNKIGKAYISPSMKNYALPVSESASQGGFGVLPKGSKIKMEEGRKLRGFTYWEKVNDIDLSVFALTEDGQKKEFSWRTMFSRQSEGITYSGDETSGYNGGSEYFDIDLPEFKKLHPGYRYLIFCDNVYSDKNFSQCVCRAGYMFRDENDSGEIFEPKTVKSSFTVNAESTFAYLFGIDLETNEFVWMNEARGMNAHVAGDTSFVHILDWFHKTEIMNIHDFITMAATETVDDPSEADIIVTDDSSIEVPEGTEIIREYDFERLRSLME